MTYLSNGPVPLKFRKPPPENLKEEEIKFFSKSEETVNFIGPSPMSISAENEIDPISSHFGDRSVPGGLLYSVKNYEDKKDAQREELPKFYSVEENPSEKSYRKYVNSYVTGVWDAPGVRSSQAGNPQDEELALINRGTQMKNLLTDSYFGKPVPDSTPNQYWREFGNQVIIELENISERLGTDQDPLLIVDDPYAFDFHPPGEVWAPVNSSVTYTTGE